HRRRGFRALCSLQSQPLGAEKTLPTRDTHRALLWDPFRRQPTPNSTAYTDETAWAIVYRRQPVGAMSSNACPSKPAADAAAPEDPPAAAAKPSLVYHLVKGAGIETRHLVVYNTGPAVGVDEATLRRVFEAYGEVERVHCPNPAAARVLISFHEVSSAVKAKAGRNRPQDVEERVRVGVPGAATASDVFAPTPGEPCPLLGRWLKVAFADMVRRKEVHSHCAIIPTHKAAPHLPVPSVVPHPPAAFDALAEGGTSSRDTRRTPCPLCGRTCGGQRGLRMHMVGAHPLEIRDRQHFVELLRQGNASLPPMTPTPPSQNGAADNELKRLVGGDGEGWDPRTAVDKNGSSVLDWAAGEGRLEVCRYLLHECGVDPGGACLTRGRGEGRTSLHWAARGGHEEVRYFAATRKASNTACMPADSAAAASATGDTSSDNDSGSRYVCPDVAAAEGTTPLHWACWGAHLSTCRLLFERGADHRSVNAYGCNVAHWCGLSGDVEDARAIWLAKSVEEGGAGGLDWAKTNLQGHTICHKAALKGHRDLVKWLVEQTNAS
ncbi:unnamed protein product, partial [Scytosiphon promiscuus]